MQRATPVLFTVLVLVLFLKPAICRPEHPKTYTVAMITWRHETQAEKGFKDSLSRYGYRINWEMFDAEQDTGKLSGFLPRIKKLNPDLIYVFGTTATRIVLAGITDIPVLFNVVTRPVEAGIIKSWSRSGNNATGVSSMVPLINQLRALKKVVDYKVLGMLYNPREPNSLIQKKIVQSLSRQLHFTLMACPISHARDIEPVISELSNRADAVYLPSDSKIISLGRPIMTLVNRYRLPSLSAVERLVLTDDALMGLVPDYYDLGTLAASSAIRIFNGEDPGEIPCATLKYFRISINMRTARKTAVQIPTALLIMSDTIVR